MSTPERDRSVERLLSEMREASGADAAAGDACLDASDLAAWAEGALPPSRATVVLSHLATCGRCQSVAAAFIKAEPAVAPRPFWSRWQVVVPAVISAAAAATFAFALWPRRNAPVTPSATIAQTESAPVSVPPALVPAPPAVAVEPQPPRQPGTSREAETNAPRPQRSAPRPVVGQAKAATRADLASEQSDRASAVAAKPQAAPPPATMPPPPPAMPLVPPPTPPASSTTTVIAESPLIDSSKAASPQFRSIAGTTAVAEFTSGGSGARAVAAGGQAASPAPPIKWRVLASGAVQRSFDNGSTWSPVSLPSTEPVVTGVSPSREVCWLVGHAGLVLLMTNGQAFTPVTRPTTVDLRRVQIDGPKVSVTATDGSSFSTTDNGRTWTKEGLLQDFPAASF